MSGNGVVDFAVSTVAFVTATETSDSGFRYLMEGIATGRWRGAVKLVRDAFYVGGKDGAAEFKRRLPGILWSGTFERRASGALRQHSGLICVDLDDLGDRVDGIRDLIVAEPHTLAAFRSPTGSGLKVVFRCDPLRIHADSFRAAEMHCLAQFGLVIDPACKDVARLCFVSDDPESFIADDALVLDYPPIPVESLVDVGQTQRRVDFPAGYISPGDDFNARGDWAAVLKKYGWTTKQGIYWTRPGKKDGVSATWGIIPNRFYCFTSGAEPFASHSSNQAWHIFAFLECGGNFLRAAQELYELGFGTRRKERPNQVPPEVQAKIDEENEQAVTPEPTQIEEDIDPEQLARLTAAYHQRLLADSPLPPKKEIKSAIEEWIPRRAGFGRILRPETPTIYLKGIPVCNRCNIDLMTALQKSGKSAVGGAIIGAVIAGKHPRGDTLGFTAYNEFAHAVIHLDTEQSPTDHEALISIAKRRADTEQTPDWLYSYGVKGIPVDLLNKTVDRLVREIYAKHGGLFAVLLDGVADFVNDINDPKECNPFVTKLEAMATDFDCSVINILHLNPSPNGTLTKSRGHLGSQLERKCETDLRLVKDANGVTTIYTASARHAPIFEKDGPRFSWDTQARMHLTSLSVGSAKDEAKLEKLHDSAEAAFHHAGKDRLRYSEFLKAIMGAFGVGEDRAESRFTEIRKFGVIEKDMIGCWALKSK